MYATAEDMRARYSEKSLVQLADAAEWGEAAIAAINVKLADASALADGYVAKYYAAAPGVGVPPLLVQLVCKIAFADLQESPSDEATRQSKSALATLRDISTGLVKLDQGEVELPARGGAILLEDPGRRFSRDKLSGF